MDKGHEASTAERSRDATVEQIKSANPTIAEAFSTVSISDLAHINEIPCARSSLLYGILAGVSIGGIRFFLMKRRGAQALNWSAGTFAAVSLASFEGCRFQRYQERSRMKYAVGRVEVRRKEARTDP